MPATEQTWRDSKLLHIVFGVSGVAMLVTTVWMLAADHNREWKPVQRKFREIETWYTQAKINDQDDASFRSKRPNSKRPSPTPRRPRRPRASSRRSLDEARAARRSKRLSTSTASKRPTRPCATSRARQTARASRSARRRLAGPSASDGRSRDRKAQFDEDKRFSLLKFRRADLDVVRSNYNLGVGEGLPEAELKIASKAVNDVVANVNEMTLEYQQAKTHRLELEQISARPAPRRRRQKGSADHQADLDRLVKAKADRQLIPYQRNSRPADHQRFQQPAEDRADLAAEADVEQ